MCKLLIFFVHLHNVDDQYRFIEYIHIAVKSHQEKYHIMSALLIIFPSTSPHVTIEIINWFPPKGVSAIGLENGLSPSRRQAIILTNADLQSITTRVMFSTKFLSKFVCLLPRKVLSAELPPSCFKVMWVTPVTHPAPSSHHINSYTRFIAQWVGFPQCGLKEGHVHILILLLRWEFLFSRVRLACSVRLMIHYMSLV